MRAFLAILFALLSVLPAPMVMGLVNPPAAPACAEPAVCLEHCACCRHACLCESDPAPAPAPLPAAPLRSSDLFPAAAMPPQPHTEFCLPVATAESGRSTPATATIVRSAPHVPLFVRHRAFLL